MPPKKYDRIELVYNQFKNAAVQIQTTEQFLPVEMMKKMLAQSTNYDFIYEPSKEYIIRELIPRSLKIQLYKAMLDSNAAEHGARMTAMHQATDNATDLLGDLTLQYNKARQATITGEILEIVSGAEALKDKIFKYLVMTPKIVGGFDKIYLYNTSVNLKRKQAMLRSNL